MASKIVEEVIEFEDVFSSLEALNEATWFKHFDTGHTFSPDEFEINTSATKKPKEVQIAKFEKAKSKKKPSLLANGLPQMPDFDRFYEENPPCAYSDIDNEKKSVMSVDLHSPETFNLDAIFKKKTSLRSPPGFDGPRQNQIPAVKEDSNDIFFKQYGVCITGAKPKRKN